MTTSAPLFLGIDIAGATNTWIALLQLEGARLGLVQPPARATLREIVTLADTRPVVAAVVDAQLTAAIDDETGYRTSDLELKRLLPRSCSRWVASISSLMAVPVRGQLIAASLGTTVGTLLETHPRACLHFAATTDEHRRACHAYKPPQRRTDAAARTAAREAASAAIQALWTAWSQRFGIEPHVLPCDDGALDAAVCATIGVLFHTRPQLLQKLGHDQPCRVGRGPFYVLRPDT